MEQIKYLDLRMANWRAVGNCGYPALELKIRGKFAYIYQPNINSIEDGFIHFGNLDGETDWEAILPEVKLSAEMLSAMV